MNILGHIIREIRKSKRMTQKDLAKLTGFKQNTVSNHESGKRSLDEEDILKYARALNIHPQDLFNKYRGEKKPPAILSTYSQLTPPRQHKVYTFASKQLDEQNASLEPRHTTPSS